MPVSPLDYLRHIRDEAHYLAEESARTTKSQFNENETTKRAFVRSIEVIGEAAKRIPIRPAKPTEGKYVLRLGR